MGRRIRGLTLNVAAAERRRTRAHLVRWKADLLGFLAIASVVVTVWIWARAGGFLQTFVYPQFAVESQALLTGLLAQTLMGLQVVFLARIPWVERAWGHDVLVGRHRLLGYWSFWLMVAHVALFAISRVGRDGDGALPELYRLFIGDSWMLLASLGTLMLIVVVVTSIRAARRRIRYESWHLIHLYSYLGLVLAFPHQLFDGTHFHEMWTQAFWWTMFIAALVVTLVYRVWYPLRLSRRHRLTVTAVTTEAHGISAITMHGRHLDGLRVRSGQFFIWRFLGGPGWTRGHPYTISAAPRDDRLRISVAVVGDGSARAAAIPTGTRVLIEGPYGTLTDDLRRHRSLLMIAAGVGITPFVGMLDDADYAPGEATLMYRFRSADAAAHLDELHEIAQRRTAALHLLAGPRRSSDSWLPEEVPARTDEAALRDLAPNILDSDVFICGPEQWIRLVRRTLIATGVHRKDLHSENYAW